MNELEKVIKFNCSRTFNDNEKCMYNNLESIQNIVGSCYFCTALLMSSLYLNAE